MKKLAFMLSLALSLLFNSCSDENDSLPPSAGEAERAETYQSIKQAVEKNFAINEMLKTSEGYKTMFANGEELTIKNGKAEQAPLLTIGANGNWFLDGVDTGKKSVGDTKVAIVLRAEGGNWYIDNVDTGVKTHATTELDTPYIVVVLNRADTYTFYLSDATTLTLRQTKTIGLYALAEGTMGTGNGQLAYFDYNTETGKFVRNEARRVKNFGDTPNDLLMYGSKMYCAITGTGASSSMVRVMNRTTGATIQDIAITKETTTMQPRRLAASGGKVYVSLYPGGVAQIDTLSYTTKVAALTGNLTEGICVYGTSLYACNSGQGRGNTISVVDLAQFAEKETITVPYNPVNIVSAGNGELYFNTSSVWSGPAQGAPANLHVLNTSTKKVTKTFDISADFIVAGKNYIYTTALDWGDFSTTLQKISIADKKASDFTASKEKLMFGYKLAVNPLNGEVFVTQQIMGQGIYRFKEDGTHIETLETGQENGAAVAFANDAW